MKLKYENTSQLTLEDLTKISKTIDSYVDRLNQVAGSTDLYGEAEGSVNLSIDSRYQKQINDLLTNFDYSKLKYILVIGIGGANLGSKAIYDAIYGYYDLLEPERTPKIIYLDTNDPLFIIKTQQLLQRSIEEPEELAINIISKSGVTAETIFNTRAILDVLPLEAYSDRIIVTSGTETELTKQAQKLNLRTISVPEIIGDRYSIFSANGLIPLRLAGIETKEFLDGAKSSRMMCLDSNIATNPALQSAAILFSHFNEGKVISDNFFFHPELESLGKWYRQLMGESNGKESTLDGKIVHTGITPSISLGSVDLHSVLQLYLGGPRNKITTFISSRENHEINQNVILENNPPLEQIIPEIKDASAGEIMWAILQGVKIAYQNQELPFMEIQLEEVSLFELGSFMQYKMFEMMYLGALLNINVFEKPNVESYKVETKRILNSHTS
ncbi:hypothetical protein KC571_01320 [candidate division WWE3 bacterium]|uniref:Glucose-6-phosphate isomerase n=1 Tax=candidate division WWE3 bacterium TaxID=2053526 RepID=A0A955LGD6_UNCKA|nr:hypothetical protein [candidate division WWE3 bacterium]